MAASSVIGSITRYQFSVASLNETNTVNKLLGSLPFVSRTFEGHFKDSPYVLDMDANLYIGPADQLSREITHLGLRPAWVILS